MKKIVIIGATSAIAEQCARLWSQREAVDMVLVGRNADKAERVAQDLGVRSPASCFHVVQADFIDAAAITRTVAGIMQAGAVDLVLIAHGSLPSQPAAQANLQLCRDALEVNAISPMLFAEAFAGHMETAKHGTLVLIGSVAGDRGRKSNYIYGAAKGLVTRYAQGLQHRFAGTEVKVVLIKPGPTDTPMTTEFKQKGIKMASALDVAQCIVRGIDQGKLVIYAPTKWSIIMMVIRHLPQFIFEKMDI